MDVSLSLQLITVGISALVGFCLGILKTVLGILMLPIGKNLITNAVTDIIFSVIAAFTSYSLFLIFTYGQVRGYVLFFELLGFLCYIFSFGKLSIKFEKKVGLYIKAVKFKIKEKILQKKEKKQQEKSKKHLQDAV